METWPFLDQNHGLTPLQKCQFFDFLNFLLLQRRKVFFWSRISSRRFFVLEYHKRHLPGLYCLKKHLEKWNVFGPKPWVNPFGKLSILPLFELLLFIAQKGVFSFQSIIKDIFLAYITLKKKLDKWPFLYQNHGLTPLEKWPFFDFFNFFNLQP